MRKIKECLREEMDVELSFKGMVEIKYVEIMGEKVLSQKVMEVEMKMMYSRHI